MHHHYQAQCYCGKITFQILRPVKPNVCTYCHCQSCRRAHSAPMYQVCYIPSSNFQILTGINSIKQFNKGQGYPIRSFCIQCGSRIYIKIPNKPQLGIGFYPALLQEKLQHDLPQELKPTKHYLSQQAVICLEKFDDGLTRT